ncbi:MAG: glucosaminidase domain-containing protein [Prevotellaceae bacterium]|jgi:LysM repeat protein|nr:glucosaminidase domain-containing protein [Prevotellaceae bacterium]
MKKISLIILLCSSILVVFAQKKTKYVEFIEKYKDLAVREQHIHGIPASITMAQALLESAAGESMLAVKGKNFFGVKCGSNWTGKTINKDDDRIQECFRKYNEVIESYEDHSEFLKRPRYEPLFKYPLKDYQSWANGLQKAGYATDKNYANKLIILIEDYNLNDLIYLTYNSKGDAISSKDERKKYSSENTEEFSDLLIRTQNNGITCYKLKQDATIEDVSVALNKRNIKILLYYNDMFEDATLSAGTYVYTTRKKNKANENSRNYSVGVGDSMHSVAQKFGITLKSLYRRNNITYGIPAREGMVLYLR